MSEQRIIIADVLDGLRQLPDGSVQCCVTSPPYWGLRDYGVAGQIGLEKTPAEFIARMVEVFREVRRVLRDDGTCWVNIGDSYNGAKVGSTHENTGAKRHNTDSFMKPLWNGAKPKDLVGIPWMLAFALRDDGWVLRQEIVWHKPAPMPESVRDRCTKAHESIFLLAKAKWSGPNNGRFAHISDSDARWLALLVDAEGCIVVKRCQHHSRADTFAPQVSIGNTSAALMNEVVRIVGHGSVLDRAGTNKRMLYWQLSNGVARDLLHRIYPFLIIKQRQARIAMYVDSLTYYRGGRKPERKMRTYEETSALESLWLRCKACNHFGEPDLSDVPEPKFGRWTECNRYFMDMEAVKEPCLPASALRAAYGFNPAKGDDANHYGDGFQRGPGYELTKANLRSVWTMSSGGFSGAHFAVFPIELPERCIRAGTSAKGCCQVCGAAWKRIVTTERVATRPGTNSKVHGIDSVPEDSPYRDHKGIICGNRDPLRHNSTSTTAGWQPTCTHDAGPVPCTVLDPFCGAATTLLAAQRLGRRGIGIELNPEYAAMGKRRLEGEAPLLANVT